MFPEDSAGGLFVCECRLSGKGHVRAAGVLRGPRGTLRGSRTPGMKSRHAVGAQSGSLARCLQVAQTWGARRLVRRHNVQRMSFGIEDGFGEVDAVGVGE